MSALARRILRYKAAYDLASRYNEAANIGWIGRGLRADVNRLFSAHS